MELFFYAIIEDQMIGNKFFKFNGLNLISLRYC